MENQIDTFIKNSGYKLFFWNTLSSKYKCSILQKEKKYIDVVEKLDRPQ